MKTGICKLCLQKRNLCNKSHIFPDFHFKFLYGSDHALVFLNYKKSEIRYNSEYESNILCEKCDGKIIGKLDDYAAKLIHDKFRTKTIFRLEQINGKKNLILENSPNYDYSIFKLFLISLLWRASISSRPFFQAIKLQPNIEEELRSMILRNEPGDPQKYPCFINLPPLVSTPNGGLGFSTFYMPTMSPMHVKEGEFEAHEFVIEGIHYIFIISTSKTWNIIPSVERSKLTIGFASIQDQREILEEVMQMIKKNRNTPNASL
jgi:hypothetical protein